MSMRDDNLRLTLMKAVADTVAKFMAEAREQRLPDLLDFYDDNGSKSLSVRLPDGTKVATISLPEKKEFFEVTDKVAFLTWAREHHPEWIETVVVPPQPEITYEEVSETQANRYLKGLAHQGDVAFDGKTGEVVDGVTYHPKGRPTSFSVLWEGEGKERIIDAWRTGQLAEIVGTDVLPQIEGL